MGCSASKLEDEEAVQLCKERKNFVKQAIEQRLRFASGHAAYVQSVKRVSLALCNYIDGDEHNYDFYSDSCPTPPFTPVKKLMNPDIIRIPPKPIQYEKHHHHSNKGVYCLRSGGNSAVSVEERPRSPETVRVSSYYPSEHFGIEGFNMQSSPYDRPSSHPPPSPQNSQWDFFWNPFSSLENYGYPSGNDHESIMTTDDTAGLRRVREEEGIPDLEDEDEEELQQQWSHHHQQQEQQRQQWYRRHYQQQQEQQQWHSHQQQQNGQQWHQHHQLQQHHHQLQQQQQQQQQQKLLQQHNLRQQRSRADMRSVREDIPRADISAETNNNYTTDAMHQMKEFQTYDADIDIQVSTTQKDFVIDLQQDKEIIRNKQPAEETRPGFTVYINRHPGSISEVMRDIESQFIRICDSAQEVSMILEASKAQYMSNSNELTAVKMLNPVALFRTASSRSTTSSRFLPHASSSCSRDDNFDSSSEYSEESCVMSGSHQSTLDRLYAWEKKLYEEVKSGERIRVAYEKKCMQLKRQDASGEDHSSMDKTRKAAQDLHTRIKISIHSIEAISRRIEKLRDEELHAQLLELIQGLGRMWRTMADSHRIQKRAVDEAKLLLATPKLSGPPPPLIRLAHSATNLEAELRNWRLCLVAWVTAQRSYVHALAGWLLRCAPRLDPTIVSPETVRSPLSPPRSSGAPPIFNICIQWSRLVDSVSETQAVDGLDFFAAGIASVVGMQREQATLAAKQAAAGREEEEEEEEEDHHHERLEMSADKIAEVAVRVVCAGMSVAVSSLSEFTMCSMEVCDNVLRGEGEEKKKRTHEV